jgi:hypothetical protein
MLSSRKSPIEKMKEIEAERDSKLAKAGQVYVDTMARVETAHETSDRTNFSIYKQTKDDARVAYDLAIKKAQDDLDKANRGAEEVFSDAPNKAKEDYQKGKIDAISVYNETKSQVEKEYNSKIESLNSEV